jgi:hypothetical protein
VATPTVRAIFGTASISLLKKRALARIVSYARVLTRVREARDEPSYKLTSGSWIDVSPEALTRLVESNVSIFTNTTQKQFDPAVRFDAFFVRFAFGI